MVQAGVNLKSEGLLAVSTANIITAKLASSSEQGEDLLLLRLSTKPFQPPSEPPCSQTDG